MGAFYNEGMKRLIIDLYCDIDEQRSTDGCDWTLEQDVEEGEGCPSNLKGNIDFLIGYRLLVHLRLIVDDGVCGASNFGDVFGRLKLLLEVAVQ